MSLSELLQNYREAVVEPIPEKISSLRDELSRTLLDALTSQDPELQVQAIATILALFESTATDQQVLKRFMNGLSAHTDNRFDDFAHVIQSNPRPSAGQFYSRRFGRLK